MENRNKLIPRLIAGAVGVGGLVLVFVFQRTDVLPSQADRYFHFSVNRFLRILLNDACMLLVLHALFADKKVLRLAVAMQIVDLFLLLPLYLALKLSLEGASELSSPFLSQLHRLIVHPTLMILLIPAVYYQKIVLKRT